MGTEIIGVAGLIVLIITNIYMISRFLTKLELKPSETRVEEMISDKLEGHCPFVDMIENTRGEKLEKIIDNRIDVHPVLKEYGVTVYRINQLEPDVKQIKADIANIKLALARISKNGSE